MINEENLENIDDNLDFVDSDETDDTEFEFDNKGDVSLVTRNPNIDFFDDEMFDDIDFSDFKGDFKTGLKKINKRIVQKKAKFRAKKKPLTKKIGIERNARVFGRNGAKTMSRVLVPRDRKVVVEGVDKFILSQDDCSNAYKNIGYYKCKKLQELIFTFNNNSGLDFNLELFNPSMPLDYLFSTSGNLNNKIQVAGGNAATYTDVLWNLLANPTMIVNARLVVAGNVSGQQDEVLSFINKNIKGEQKVAPLNVNLNLDNMQFQSSVINFDIMGTLNRPFIPDGMDVVNYTVLAGNTVTFCFYYKQISLKKLLYKEASASKKLM